MVDFTINDAGTATGAAGADKLTYNISIAGGVTVSVTGSLATGYAGTFNGPTTNDGVFTGIESFEFNDIANSNDNLTLGDGADRINAGGGNDIINAAGGDDTINAGAGNDVVVAGAGNDIIDSGLGADSINAGTGDDTITVTLENANTVDTIDGGIGTDTLIWSGGTDAVTLSASAITTASQGVVSFSNIERFNITGSSAADDMTTGAGNDTLNGGFGADVLNSGAGNDSVSGGDGDDVINSGSGTDKIFGGVGVDYLTMNLASATTGINISLSNEAGAAANNSTFGTGGIVQGIEGLDIVTGSGNDTIRGYFNDGNTILTNDSFFTGAGNDAIRVYLSGADVVNAGDGTDAVVIYAEDGVALTTSGAVIGATFGAVYSDTTGNSVTVTNAETMFVFGSALADLIITGNGDDAVYGGAGDDLISTARGKGYVDGGTGLDMWVLNTSASTAGASININRAVNDVGTYQVAGKFTNIEGLTMTGGAAGDKVTTHITAVMDDTLNLAGGFDTAIIALRGVDTVNLGSGIDTLVVNATSTATGAGANVNLGAFTTGLGHAGSASEDGDSIAFTGVDYLTFNGNNGDDTAIGGSGIDRLYGNAGDDILAASSNADRLFGGAGADTITGGTGSDQMTGGAGDDVFVFTKVTYAGVDKIMDFENGVDLIQVNGSGANFANSIKSIVASGGGTDTLITFFNNATITLEDQLRSEISAADFIFN